MRSDTSTGRAIRRRMAILVLLQAGPRSSREIITTLEQDGLFFHKRTLDPATIARREHIQIKQDIDALRLLHYDISYDFVQRRFHWTNSPFGLSLAPEQLASLALLLETFQSLAIPHADEIANLLIFLANHLPAEQQELLQKQHPSFSIDLRGSTDYRNADPVTIKTIERAIQKGQQLEFQHRSARDGEVRRHVIEPQPLVFRRGHVYLTGWSIDRQKELSFRLDYILPGTARMLSTSSIKLRPASRSYTLRYRLSAIVARNSVSEHFPDHHVERHEDGSATITAQVTDLFEVAQILFRYREHCIVLDPPELVEQMRASAEKIYLHYHTPERRVQLNPSGDGTL